MSTRCELEELASRQQIAPAILVIGAGGGAGATTTALGLAAAIGTTTNWGAVAIDATTSGGDLGVRGADELMRPMSLQSWLTEIADGATSITRELLQSSSTGAGLLWRDDTALPARATIGTTARLLRLSGYLGIYDGGGHISAGRLLPLICDGHTSLIVATPARRGTANRLFASLKWLDHNLGGDVVADTTVVVTYQDQRTGSLADEIRRSLNGWVRDVFEVPYDPHVAGGVAVSVDQLHSSTTTAYADIVMGVGL
ncbi:MinD/ParA family ATP-binding protein [Nocardia brasiliensis]